MTVEALLQPRYMVIADYPNNPFNIGDIIMLDDRKSKRIYLDVQEWDVTDPNWLHAKDVENYPAIFSKLNWWEYRTIEDLPEYAEYNHCEIIKITKWNDDCPMPMAINDKYEIFANHLKPATLAEYTNYLTTKPNYK